MLIQMIVLNVELIKVVEKNINYHDDLTINYFSRENGFLRQENERTYSFFYISLANSE